jgi:hypothetical protein
MGSDIEDTGEILFEDGPTERHAEAAPREWELENSGLTTGARRYPTFIRRVGRLFRLQREEIVSRGGERTHFRLTYRRVND